ncbi:thermonuclease family protein [Thermodesulfobacteriota bacterium]
MQEVDKDRYGRTVALVEQNNKSINAELIRAGFAWSYRKDCKKKTYEIGYYIDKVAHKQITREEDYRNGAHNKIIIN